MSEKPSWAQLERMIGNPDVYAVQLDDGSYSPVRSRVSRRVLEQHLAEEITIGTYIGHVQNGETVARTLCFDIDSGANEESLAQARKIGEALNELGLPLSSAAIEDSGRRGYHVWVVLQEYRPNHELRRVGRAVLALAGVQCEVYPKQDQVRDLGNLVKLPGSVHRLTGNQNNFLVKPPRPMPVEMWERVYRSLPPEIHARRGVADSRFPCMEAIQGEGVAEGGRNIQLFHLATLLRRAGVDDDNTEMVIRATNEKCQPPLEDDELLQLLDSSRTSGPICSQLPEERQCGELCIQKRMQGLYTRPGQLRYAGVGENVVVTVAARKGNMVEFEHDDVGKMKAVLRYGH